MHDQDDPRTPPRTRWSALDLVALADMVAERPELAGVGMTPILEGVTA